MQLLRTLCNLAAEAHPCARPSRYRRQRRSHRTPVITLINRTEIANIFDVIVALDGVAGLQAAKLATDDDYFRLNQENHVEITRLANNPVLLNIWTTLHANVFRARAAANYDARRWAESVDEQEAFMALLRVRDAPAFAAALSAHTRKTGDAVLMTLESAVPPHP